MNVYISDLFAKCFALDSYYPTDAECEGVQSALAFAALAVRSDAMMCARRDTMSDAEFRVRKWEPTMRIQRAMLPSVAFLVFEAQTASV